MKLEGERKLPGTPERLWYLLLDPDVLVSAIPGCKKLEQVEEDHYQGVIAAKVGSIQSQYNTTFKITDKNPPNSYRINVQGQGSAGFVNGNMQMELQPDGDGTRMHYAGEANVGGRIAQVGQRMVQATASAMIDKGFNDLRVRVKQELETEGAAAAPTGSEAAMPKRGTATRTARRSQPTARKGGGLWHSITSFFSALWAFLRALFRSPRS